MSPEAPLSSSNDSALPQEVRHTLVRLRARAWGVSTGLLFGFALFAATVFLVIRSGADVGAHLVLLAVFLPGYSVTLVGSLLGFVYAFLIGYVLGWSVGRLYGVFERSGT